MKLKSRPDDFQVEELTSVVPASSGEFAYYRLEKQSLGTPEAIQKFCKSLRIDPRRVRYGGLKDRHALTIQYLSIDDGPPRDFRDALIQLKYLGQVEEPYGPHAFHGNRFTITLRDIKQEELDRLLLELDHVRVGVISNYYDDQRFGSVTEDNQYIARALIDGDEEKALRLAISSYYEHDRSQDRKAKVLLRSQWGQWSTLRYQMPPTHLERIVMHLARAPQDFRGAFTLIPFFLRNMYLSAYQSYLWNSVLSDWIITNHSASELVAVQQKKQSLPMLNSTRGTIKPDVLSLQIPLASARLRPQPDELATASLLRALAKEGLQLEDMRLKQYREPFFSKGSRAAFYIPQELSHEIGWDKLNKGNRKLKLSFTLDRGSYATLLVKRLTACKPWQAATISNCDPECPS